LASNHTESIDSEKRSAFARLQDRLGKTRARFSAALGGLLGGGKIDPQSLEELETLLLSADVGISTTEHIIERLQKAPTDAPPVQRLRRILLDILEPCVQPLRPESGSGPFVIMVVGVNGTGKTTSVGKLAWRLSQEGKNVLLAAADTFRAAATEQLENWGERSGCAVIRQPHGADAASVAHDAVQAAVARDVDVLIVDTAGRQHTHGNLMDELRKIRRVVARLLPGAPHEVLMVLDAGTGQNALAQLASFSEAVDVTGLCLTKLDGTARGGIVFALARETGLPLRLVGIGEGAEDLRPFDAAGFVDALLPGDAA